MKRAVLVEDEVRFQQCIIDTCREYGYEVVLVITPVKGVTAAEIVGQIVNVDPDLVLLDHDFPSCGDESDGLTLCGLHVYEELGELQSRVMSISGMQRLYTPDTPNFNHKDCLVDNESVRRDFGLRLIWLTNPNYIPPA